MHIAGIQQIGIGVSRVHEAFQWYNRHLGMDIPIFEEAAEAALMLPYTGGQPRSRHAILAINLHGGGGFEIWQYTSRTPVPPTFTPQMGDLGLFITKIKCADAQAVFHRLRKMGVNMVTNPAERPDGKLHFHLKDPWGNIFEIVEASVWLNTPKVPEKSTGGVYGSVIGVSDMDRSIQFYKDVLGYDTVLYDQKGDFADWHGIDGGYGQFRRVLLGHSERRKGAFSTLLGPTEIELVQSLERTPRKIFEDRFWGDLGFIHLCFDIDGMDEMKRRCAELGHPFTVDSSGSFDMGEAAGYFAYIEDPDGALIEFVETHKIPIIKKLGWYLDLRKRSRRDQPLSGLMLKALGLGRVKLDA